MKKYVQAVDGVVNLIGGPEVGLFGTVSEGRVIVREMGLDPVEIGWIDNGDKFVPAPVDNPVIVVDPLDEINQRLDDLALMILETGGAVK